MQADLTIDDIPALIERAPEPPPRPPGERRPAPAPAAAPPPKWAWLILDDRGLRIEPKAA